MLPHPTDNTSRLVMPMNDPQGQYFPHLLAITPLLKTVFEDASLSLTPETRANQPDYVAWLESDPFFHLVATQPDTIVGQQFLALYTAAVTRAEPEQILHLCFIDRLAFALQSDYQNACMSDLQSLTPAQTPLIFSRSKAAWASHPRNYYQIETMATTAGELLFGQTLDFAWCHLVVRATDLGPVLSQVKSPRIDMIAEIVLGLRPQIQTHPVDWLAWEDPFFEGRDLLEFKAEREASPAETQKRLGYVVPMLDLLLEASRNIK